MKRSLPLLCLFFTACDGELKRADAPTPTPAPVVAPTPATVAKTTPVPTPTPWRPTHAKQLIPPGKSLSRPSKLDPKP